MLRESPGEIGTHACQKNLRRGILRDRAAGCRLDLDEKCCFVGTCELDLFYGYKLYY